MQIYLARNGQQTGPFDVGQIKAMLGLQQITQDVMAWADGYPAWVPINQFLQDQHATFGPIKPPLPIFTISLLAILGLVFALEIAYGGVDITLLFTHHIADDTLIGLGGANQSLIFTQGEWWRLLAATLLHAGLMHILMNSMFIWNIGKDVERMVGYPTFALVFVLTGMTGTLAFSLLDNPERFSVGASGAACGLFGFLISYGVRDTAHLLQQLKRNYLNIVLIVLIGFLVPNIDNWGHVFGFISGIVIGMSYPSVAMEWRKWAGWAAIVLLTLVLAWVAKVGVKFAVFESSVPHCDSKLALKLGMDALKEVPLIKARRIEVRGLTGISQREFNPSVPMRTCNVTIEYSTGTSKQGFQLTNEYRNGERLIRLKFVQ